MNSARVGSWLFRWSVAVWVVVGLLCAVGLTVPVVSAPADDLGIRGFRTPEISMAMQLGQTFRMTVDGLHGIAFYPAEIRPPTGDLRLDLVDITGNGATVRTRVVSAAELVKQSPFGFEFEPIQHSRNHEYRLDVAAADSDTAGVALWATKGERYTDGTLVANDRRRWADLAFRTSAPTISTWDALTGTPGRFDPGRGRLVAALLAANWIIVGAALTALVRMWSQGSQTGP